MAQPFKRSTRWPAKVLLWALVGVAVADAAYDLFLQQLAQVESSGKASTENSYGYLGLYQMGEKALIDAGYYTRDGTSKNDWSGSWTGKDGINSVQDFLSNPTVQNKAIEAYDTVLWNQIEAKGLDKYLGNTYNGTTITPSGLLAASHLLGAGGLNTCLSGSGSCVDANGTTASNYLAKLGGYDVSSITGNPVATTGGSKTGTSNNKATGTVVNGYLQTGQVGAISPNAAFKSGSGYGVDEVKVLALSALTMWMFTWSGWVCLFQFKGWRDGTLSTADMQIGIVRSAVVMLIILGIVLV